MTGEVEGLQVLETGRLFGLFDLAGILTLGPGLAVQLLPDDVSAAARTQVVVSTGEPRILVGDLADGALRDDLGLDPEDRADRAIDRTALGERTRIEARIQRDTFHNVEHGLSDDASGHVPRSELVLVGRATAVPLGLSHHLRQRTPENLDGVRPGAELSAGDDALTLLDDIHREALVRILRSLGIGNETPDLNPMGIVHLVIHAGHQNDMRSGDNLAIRPVRTIEHRLSRIISDEPNGTLLIVKEVLVSAVFRDAELLTGRDDDRNDGILHGIFQCTDTYHPTSFYATPHGADKPKIKCTYTLYTFYMFCQVPLFTYFCGRWKNRTSDNGFGDRSYTT